MASTTDKQTDLAERVAKATGLRQEGHNCAQCVALAFDDIYDNVDATTIEHALECLGTGMGDMSQTCGTLVGAHFARGLARRNPRLSRGEYYKLNHDFMSNFQQKNGSTVCRDLKAAKVPCLSLIIDAVTMLHAELAADGLI